MAMSARPRVLITKRIFPEAVEFLRQQFEVDYNATDRVLPAAELIDRARFCQAIVSQLTDRLDAAVIAQL